MPRGALDADTLGVRFLRVVDTLYSAKVREYPRIPTEYRYETMVFFVPFLMWFPAP